MTQFHQKDWESRYAQMGDEAEAKFDQVHPNSAPFGLNRPPVNLTKVPAFIRYMPDRLMHDRLIEVMGVGRDQTLKLKTDKLFHLHHWNSIHPTWLFLWDSHKKRWAEILVSDLVGVVLLTEVKEFPEGKRYYSVPVDALPVEWHNDDA